MSIGGSQEPLFVEHGWAGSALVAPDSGDLHVIAPFKGGALVALIDGLGHGPEAARAAQAAARQLEANAAEPVVALVQRCHDALRATRGAAMTLASVALTSRSLTWIGIGNVDAVLLRARRATERRHEGINTRGGVVGYQLPPLQASVVQVELGDTMILATDGIRPGYTDRLAVDGSPQEIAEAILLRHALGSDDARVLVVRFRGEPR